MKLGDLNVMSEIAALIRYANQTRDPSIPKEKRLATLIDAIAEVDLGNFTSNPFPISDSWTMIPAGTTKIDYITTGVPLTLEETAALIDWAKENDITMDDRITAVAKLITHKRTLEANIPKGVD